MDKVQHFEIPADDFERAKKFYSDVFGWGVQDFPMPDPSMKYAGAHTTAVDEKQMPKEAGAINGGITTRSPFLKHATITITVEDINKSLETVAAHGGSKVTDVMPVMDMGLLAYVKDTEGNTIGLWQNLKK